MNRWKLVVPVVACAAALFVTGCTREVVVQAPPPQGQPQGEIVVQQAPPQQEEVEVVPVAPSTEHVWIKGNWHWNGGSWIWRRGHYETRRVGFRWIPAHYVQRGGAYVYIDGYWGR